jgi:hypothetical protein
LEEGYSIRTADMPGADDLMMRIYAAMAQKERERSSERTRAALAAAKARGRVLGADHTGWKPPQPPCASLVAVHRLREVSRLYGFSRFEPAALVEDDLEDVGRAVERAPLGINNDWLPAIERFGEGLFFRLDPMALSERLEHPAIRFRRSRPNTPDRRSSAPWSGMPRLSSGRRDELRGANPAYSLRSRRESALRREIPPLIAIPQPQVSPANPQETCASHPSPRGESGSSGGNGVRGGIRTHGPRIHPTSAFAAAPRAGGVRGLDCPFAVGRNP